MLGLLAYRNVRFASFKTEPTRGDPDQAGNHPQQGGFSSPVSAGYHHRFARLHAEAQVPEDLAPTSIAGQVFSFELHHRRGRPFAEENRTAREAENPDFTSIFGVVPRSM